MIVVKGRDMGIDTDNTLDGGYDAERLRRLVDEAHAFIDRCGDPTPADAVALLSKVLPILDAVDGPILSALEAKDAEIARLREERDNAATIAGLRTSQIENTARVIGAHDGGPYDCASIANDVARAIEAKDAALERAEAALGNASLMLRQAYPPTVGEKLTREQVRSECDAALTALRAARGK